MFFVKSPRSLETGCAAQEIMIDEPQVEHATANARLDAKDTFRILLMDSVENIEQLKAACKEAGHDVVAAQTIEEAFAFLDGQDHADVIICAAHLEDESMFDFLKRLRSSELHKHAMFLTLALAPGPIGTKVNAAAESTARLLGADAFVSMPTFDAIQLISEIKKLLPDVPLLEVAKIEERRKGK